MKNYIVRWLSILLIWVTGFYVRPLHAAPVTADEVREIAERFVASNPVFQRRGEMFSVAGVTAWQSFWVAELAPKGYVIFSQDDERPPMRAFSAESRWRPDLSGHPLLAQLEQIARVEENPSVAQSNAVRRTAAGGEISAWAAQWAALRDVRPRVKAKAATADSPVGPLLTSTWGQGLYYNAMCPLRDDGGADNGGHMVNGCVALAGAQLLRYHAWPPMGFGTHAHYTQNSDFRRPMLWEEMLDAYPPDGETPSWSHIRAVAWLCMDVGSMVDMNYGNDGSSSDIYSLHSTIPAHYHYTYDARALANSDWATIAEACPATLDAGNPVLVRSVIYTDETKSDGTGHAYVVDGYYRDVDLGLMLHVNYGWDGANNGWCAPNGVAGYGELLGAIVDLMPHPFPLFRAPDGVVGPTFTLTWDVPARYEGEYLAFRVKEGIVSPSATLNLSDMALWNIHSGYGWTTLDGGGWDMAGGMPGQPNLNDTVVAHAGAQLIITHKLPTSTTVTPYAYNGVDIWDGAMSELATLPASDDFITTTHDIPAERLEQPMNIAIGVINNGAWGDPLEGVIQKIELTHCDGTSWTLVDDAIPGDARSLALTNRAVGTYLYTIESMRTDGVWDTRDDASAEPEKQSVTVAAQAVAAPRISVDEQQVTTPWTPPLQLHLTVDNPSGRPLTFAVEDTGSDSVLAPADFTFTTRGGETFLCLPDIGKITTANLQTTWVKISATTPEGAQGITWFVLGRAFRDPILTRVFTDKAAAFADATNGATARPVLLLAFNESTPLSFQNAVRTAMNDPVNQAIIQAHYTVWRVDLSQAGAPAAVAPYYRNTPMEMYSGYDFLCFVDPATDARIGDRHTSLIGTTFEEILDPDGTYAPSARLAAIQPPALTATPAASDSTLSLLISPTCPDAQYTLLSTDHLDAGFHTTNSVRVDGASTPIEAFNGPRGAAMIEFDIAEPEAADSTRFYQLRLTPAN